MSETAIITQDNRALAAYGDRDTINEITDRLMRMHPVAKEVGADTMRSVAQLAIMRGANPLPTAGEIWVWKDHRGDVQTMMGIAYYRRIASKKDTVVWETEPRLMNAAERQDYNVKDGDLGAICRGSLLSNIRELTAIGATFKEAREATARTATAVVEYGDRYYVNDSRYKKAGDERTPPHGRTWEWVAEKRAEVDFYKMMSLVDDALTERIDAVNEVREQVGKAFQLYEERETYTLEQANQEFFGIKPEAPEEPEVIDGEFDAVPWEDEPEAAATVAVDWRAKIAGNRHQTAGTVASALVAAGHRSNEHEALNSIKKRFPDVDGASTQLSTADALAVWDRIVGGE